MEYISVELHLDGQTGLATLSEDEAWSLAQFLKRLSFDTARIHAVDSHEAYRIIAATERLRAALAMIGLDPR